MARQAYVNFVNLFGEINPFELNHFSESFFNKLDELYADNNTGIKMPFSPQDIELSLINAMRTVQMELAEIGVAEAKAQAARVRALTFAPQRVEE